MEVDFYFLNVTQICIECKKKKLVISVPSILQFWTKIENRLMTSNNPLWSRFGARFDAILTSLTPDSGYRKKCKMFVLLLRVKVTISENAFSALLEVSFREAFRELFFGITWNCTDQIFHVSLRFYQFFAGLRQTKR